MYSCQADNFMHYAVTEKPNAMDAIVHLVLTFLDNPCLSKCFNTWWYSNLIAYCLLVFNTFIFCWKLTSPNTRLRRGFPLYVAYTKVTPRRLHLCKSWEFKTYLKSQLSLPSVILKITSRPIHGKVYKINLHIMRVIAL